MESIEIVAPVAIRVVLRSYKKSKMPMHAAGGCRSRAAASWRGTRHTFTSEEKVGAGRTKTLIGVSGKPPTEIVSVAMLERGVDNEYKEVVTIKEIIHLDGSVWKSPPD